MFRNLSEEQIEDIVNSVIENYPDITEKQEQVIRYCLTKVGCAYSQKSHGNHSDNVFDCSELAYMTWLNAGVDISLNGWFTAAALCQNADTNGYSVADEIQPGDLIFYGRPKDDNAYNNRYKGVYHVAIYIGNGKVVEAMGIKEGVVYGDARTPRVVGYARPC